MAKKFTVFVRPIHSRFCSSWLNAYDLSIERVLSELDDIKEVINIYPCKRRQKKERRQTVLSKTSEFQEKLMSILGLKHGKKEVLG